MTDIKHLPGFCSVTTGARLMIGVEDTVDADFTPLIQQVTAVDVADYVVINGVPHRDSAHGARVSTNGGSDDHTLHETAPLPEEVDLGTWRRWLPYSEWLTAPAAGGRRWWPIETEPGNMVASGVGTSGVPEPRTALYQSVDVSVSSDGRDVYGVNAPGIDEGYSYRGYDREMFRNAMVFDGAGHLSIEVERTFTETTFGMVAVFHPSAQPHYGIFSSNETEPTVGTPGEPLVIRYTHGRLEIYQAHVRVAAHETHKSAHQAVILLLSLSAGDDEGRLLVIDQTRTSRQFNIEDLDFVNFGGMIGAEGQATAGDPVVFTSEMDVLEFAIWDEALTFAQMEEKANLLSLAYGIAG